MSRTRKIVYWVATIWLALGMFATGITQLIGSKEGQGGADMITKLGYPVYLLTILGIWKLLGCVAVLAPRFPLLKEWAYAGFVFLMTGAIASHLIVRDPVVETLPGLLLLVLTAISWYTRPESRRLVPVVSAA